MKSSHSIVTKKVFDCPYCKPALCYTSFLPEVEDLDCVTSQKNVCVRTSFSLNAINRVALQ